MTFVCKLACSKPLIGLVRLLEFSGSNAIDIVSRRGWVKSCRIKELPCQAIALSIFLKLRLSGDSDALASLRLCFLSYLLKHNVALVRAGSSFSCSVCKVKTTERPGIASCFMARTGE